MIRPGIIFIFLGALLLNGCAKETTKPSGPVKAAALYTDDQLGKLIRDASPALYEKIMRSPDRAPTVDVRISHGRLDGIGPAPANDPICAKFACTKCICCVIVTSGSEINVNGGGVLSDVENNSIPYEEGEDAFNAANDLEGHKYFILADDHPEAVEVAGATATLSDDGQYVRIHVEQ